MVKAIIKMKNILFLLLFVSATSVFSQRNSDSLVITDESREIARKKIESIREDIINHKIDFASAAIKYSQDPGSASNGGLYQNISKGTFVSEFEGVAFSVEINKVSEVFQTDFGYHILVVIARKGDVIDVRHILIQAKGEKK